MFQNDPQAVIVRYQVPEAKEAEFQEICADGWQTYLRPRSDPQYVARAAARQG